MRLLFSIMLLNSFVIQAQMCPCEFGKSGKIRKQELGISLISSIGEPGIYRVYDKAIAVNFFSGLNYKYHLSNFSIRAQAAYKAYSVDDSQFYSPLLKPESTNGRAGYYEFRAGIERTINSGKWRLYIGADLLYGFGNAHGTQVRKNSWVTDYKVKTSYVGLSLVPGLNYRPWERVSFNLEPCFNLTRNKQSGNLPNDQYFRSYFLLNTLSINYHF